VTPVPLASDNLLAIILVEDDDGEAKAIRRGFASARIANPILRVRDGVEALTLLRGEAETPAPPRFLMLVDINLPRMSGHELVAKIREDPRLNRSVIFMLTTSHDQRDIDVAYQNHVAGYITKDRAGEQFLELTAMLQGYWYVVEIPHLEG